MTEFLSGDTRAAIKSSLFDSFRHAMFGDGLEIDYVWDGINFPGLNHMKDSELVEELISLEEGSEDPELHTLCVKAQSEQDIWTDATRAVQRMSDENSTKTPDHSNHNRSD